MQELLSSSRGDTTCNILQMAESTLGGALLLSDDVDSNGVCNTCCHDSQLQVYVEKLDNSARGLSWSVEQVSYIMSRSI